LRLLLVALSRLLFPSWAFFDVAGATPMLEVRRCAPAGAGEHGEENAKACSGQWLAALQAPTRRWWHLLFNPAGTRMLAAQTLVERWLMEQARDGADAPAAQLSLELVTNLAASSIPDAWRSGAQAGWQWRVTLRDEHGADVVHVSGPICGPMS